MDGETVFSTVVIILILIAMLAVSFGIGMARGEDQMARRWCIDKGFSDGAWVGVENTLDCFDMEFDVDRYKDKG